MKYFVYSWLALQIAIRFVQAGILTCTSNAGFRCRCMGVVCTYVCVSYLISHSWLHGTGKTSVGGYFPGDYCDSRSRSITRCVHTTPTRSLGGRK